MAFEVGSSNVKEVEVVTKKITPEEKEAYERIALIVDDESMMHKLHKRILGRFGFKTLIAENGKQAVELCQSGARFDLITMDFQMPIMDGLEVSCLIKCIISFLKLHLQISIYLNFLKFNCI